jgi:hypothetical protein
MYTRKSRITKFMLWAMIPAIVFGSLPRMGCICADGQHKTFCQRHLKGTNEAGCVCCERHVAGANARRAEKPAAAGRHACCQRAVGQGNPGCPELCAGHPCKPVVDRTEIVTSAKLALDLDRIDQTPVFGAVELLPALVSSVAADYACGKPVPPPDLITTLGVLLI